MIFLVTTNLVLLCEWAGHVAVKAEPDLEIYLMHSFQGRDLMGHTRKPAANRDGATALFAIAAVAVPTPAAG